MNLGPRWNNKEVLIFWHRLNQKRYVFQVRVAKDNLVLYWMDCLMSKIFMQTLAWFLFPNRGNHSLTKINDINTSGNKPLLMFDREWSIKETCRLRSMSRHLVSSEGWEGALKLFRNVLLFGMKGRLISAWEWNDYVAMV